MTDQITALSPPLLPDAARVIVKAFQHEVITAYWLNLSSETAQRHYARVVEAKLRLYLHMGQPLLAAMDNGRLAGVAVVKLKRPEPTAGQTLSAILPLVPRLLALTPRVRFRALLSFRQLIAAMRPPDEIPEPHQLLEAIAVHPEYQGQGIGSLLLKAVNRLAEQNEAAATYLMTGDVKNRDIYVHVGYRTVVHRQVSGLTVYHMMRERG